MRWYQTLIVGEPYFVIGFVDRKLTVPSIGTFVYLGIGTLDAGTEGKHCFQDAHSYLAEPDDYSEPAEPNYVVLGEESLDMVADKAGLIAWLKSPHSTSETAT
jgi:hypothetical protein